MCIREQEVDNKNVGQLTDDNLRALEVPIGKCSLFRDAWRALAREASADKLVIRACPCSCCESYLLLFLKCTFSHVSKHVRMCAVYLI